MDTWTATSFGSPSSQADQTHAHTHPVVLIQSVSRAIRQYTGRHFHKRIVKPTLLQLYGISIKVFDCF